MSTDFGIFFLVMIIILALSAFLCMIRAIRGPKIADRIMAANMIGTQTMVIILLLAVYLNEANIIDVALVYAVISFLAVVVITKIYVGLYRERKAQNADKQEMMPGEEALRAGRTAGSMPYGENGKGLESAARIRQGRKAMNGTSRERAHFVVQQYKAAEHTAHRQAEEEEYAPADALHKTHREERPPFAETEDSEGIMPTTEAGYHVAAADEKPAGEEAQSAAKWTAAEQKVKENGGSAAQKPREHCTAATEEMSAAENAAAAQQKEDEEQ